VSARDHRTPTGREYTITPRSRPAKLRVSGTFHGSRHAANAYIHDKGLAWDHWGLLYEQQGNLKEAEAFYKRAVAWHQTHYGRSDPQLAKSLTFLGSLSLKQKKLEEAKSHLQQALAIQEKILGDVHPDLAITLEQYAKLLRMEHHEEEAQEVDARIQSMNKRLSAHFVPNRTTPL